MLLCLSQLCLGSRFVVAYWSIIAVCPFMSLMAVEFAFHFFLSCFLSSASSLCRRKFFYSFFEDFSFLLISSLFLVQICSASFRSWSYSYTSETLSILFSPKTMKSLFHSCGMFAKKTSMLFSFEVICSPSMTRSRLLIVRIRFILCFTERFLGFGVRYR